MKIPASLYWRTRAMVRFNRMYKLMGDLESRLLKSELQSIQINKPIYITSLARSGTTIITEILSKVDNICSHTYGDFPGVFTPYWKNWLRQKQSFLEGDKAERSHGDRIMINNDSPDAFEEVLWMYFYPNLHKENQNLNKILDNKEFVNYYKNNIKKHLLVKNKTRYIAKANYNVSRIESILEIFPDAKFIIPIRHPVNHIASLVKQHSIYLKAAKDNPKIDSQLAASGHFEFGNIRKIVKMPNSNYYNKVNNLWQNKDEIEGWAHYWNGIYSAVSDLKRKTPQLDAAIQLVRYEDLCNNSMDTLDKIARHCEIVDEKFQEINKTYSAQLSLPEYYKIAFNDKEIDIILNITQPVSNDFGYNTNNYN